MEGLAAEENKRLREELMQAMQRESDVLRRLKHLQAQLAQLHDVEGSHGSRCSRCGGSSTPSDSKRSPPPDLLRWNRLVPVAFLPSPVLGVRSDGDVRSNGHWDGGGQSQVRLPAARYCARNLADR